MSNIDYIQQYNAPIMKHLLKSFLKLDVNEQTVKTWIIWFNELYKRKRTIPLNKVQIVDLETIPISLLDKPINLNKDPLSAFKYLNMALKNQSKDIKRHYMWKQQGTAFEIYTGILNKDWVESEHWIDYNYHIDYIDHKGKRIIQCKYTSKLDISKHKLNLMKVFLDRTGLKDYEILIIWREKNWRDEPVRFLTEKEAIEWQEKK